MAIQVGGDGPGDGQQAAEGVAAGVDDFATGFLVGLLVGEGHFGGDGRQAQVTLRMHVDHEAVFRWLMARFPESRLYGPYDHAGRRYYQWMARGAFLRERLVPLLEHSFRPEHSERAFRRYRAMCERYLLLAPGTATPGDGGARAAEAQRGRGPIAGDRTPLQETRGAGRRRA